MNALVIGAGEQPDDYEHEEHREFDEENNNQSREILYKVSTAEYKVSFSQKFKGALRPTFDNFDRFIDYLFLAGDNSAANSDLQVKIMAKNRKTRETDQSSKNTQQ